MSRALNLIAHYSDPHALGEHSYHTNIRLAYDRASRAESGLSAPPSSCSFVMVCSLASPASAYTFSSRSLGRPILRQSSPSYGCFIETVEPFDSVLSRCQASERPVDNQRGSSSPVARLISAHMRNR